MAKQSKRRTKRKIMFCFAMLAIGVIFLFFSNSKKISTVDRSQDKKDEIISVLNDDNRNDPLIEIATPFGIIYIDRSREGITCILAEHPNSANDRANGENYIQSCHNTSNPAWADNYDNLGSPFWSYTRAMMASHAFFTNEPKKFLVLGMGCASLAQQINYFYGHQQGFEMDLIDINPLMFDLSHSFCGFTPLEGTYYHVVDAYDFVMTKSPDSYYDFILQDVFAGVTIPPQFFSKEYITKIHAILVPGGIFSQNLLRDSPLEGFVNVFGQQSTTIIDLQNDFSLVTYMKKGSPIRVSHQMMQRNHAFHKNEWEKMGCNNPNFTIAKMFG